MDWCLWDILSSIFLGECWHCVLEKRTAVRTLWSLGPLHISETRAAGDIRHSERQADSVSRRSVYKVTKIRRNKEKDLG